MCFLKDLKWKAHICVVLAVRISGGFTTERVALVMNIVPCRELNLACLVIRKPISVVVP